MAAIKVASVKKEKGGTHIQNVGFSPWGAFSDDDVEVLEGSLRDTISVIQQDRVSLSESQIYLYVLVRRYFVVNSYDSAGILAAVSWFAADSDCKPIYYDLFYAADYYSGPFFLQTIGRQKDSINEKILRRIIEKSIALATSGGGMRAILF